VGPTFYQARQGDCLLPRSPSSEVELWFDQQAPAPAAANAVKVFPPTNRPKPPHAAVASSHHKHPASPIPPSRSTIGTACTGRQRHADNNNGGNRSRVNKTAAGRRQQLFGTPTLLHLHSHQPKHQARRGGDVQPHATRYVAHTPLTSAPLFQTEMELSTDASASEHGRLPPLPDQVANGHDLDATTMFTLASNRHCPRRSSTVQPALGTGPVTHIHTEGWY